MSGIYTRTPLIITFSLALITCSACGDPQDSSAAPTANPAAEASPGSTPALESTPLPADMTRGDQSRGAAGAMTPQQQTDHAQTDLANRLGLNPAEVSVVTSGPVTWRSGALGCPKPGMNYTQALVPGFQIILQAGNTTYHYHAKSGAQPFHCPQNRIEPPSQDRAYE